MEPFTIQNGINSSTSSEADFPFSVFEPVATQLLTSLSFQRSRLPDLRVKSILLVGNNGTGKKSLIRALSKKLELYLIEIDISRLGMLTSIKRNPLECLILLSDDESGFCVKDVSNTIDLINNTLVSNNLAFVAVTSNRGIPDQLEAMFDLAMNVQSKITLANASSVLRYIFYPITPPNSETELQISKNLVTLSWSQVFSFGVKMLKCFLEKNASRGLWGNFSSELCDSFWNQVLLCSDYKPGFLLNHPDILGLKKQCEILEQQFSSLCDASGGPSIPRKRGILLHGPPGTGKTFLVKKLLEGGRVNIIVVSLTDWVRSEIGAPHKFVHSTFVTAKKTQPSIIFADELEALFGSSNHLLDSSSPSLEDYGYTSTCIINQLSEELEDIDPEMDKVIFIAATNYPERIPKVLLGPNKINLLLNFGPPSSSDIISLISSFKSNGIIDQSTDVKSIADCMANLTICEVNDIIKDASIRSRVDSGTPSTDQHIKSALYHFKNSKIDSNVIPPF